MGRTRRRLRAGLACVALAAGLVTGLPAHRCRWRTTATTHGDATSTVTLPPGFADVKVVKNISEATAVAFAPDGTAFIALKTGVIKSFDYDATTTRSRTTRRRPTSPTSARTSTTTGTAA